MKRPCVTEQQVAEVVVAYLEAMGADVYQEVEVSGGVADIVARVRAEVWIVEVKVTLRLSLITQALERRRLAHRVIVAAPHTRHMGEIGVLCSEVGLGLWDVNVGSSHLRELGFREGHPNLREAVAPRRLTGRPVALAADLQPEHKTHARAGAASAAGRWTPFRATCEELVRIVAHQPGITVKAAVEAIKHHYTTNRSAVSSIAHWIERGKVDGVRIERSAPLHGGNALRLFPVERQP